MTKRILVMVLLLGMVFPIGGVVLNSAKSTLAANTDSFPKTIFLSVSSASPSTEVAAVINKPSNTSVVNSASNCLAAQGGSDVVSGPSIINLNQPAQCFTFSANKVEVTKNIKVMPLASQKVTVVVVTKSLFSLERIPANDAKNIPLVSVSILGLIAIEVVDKNKIKSKFKKLFSVDVLLDKIDSRMLILRC